ncbi:nucleosome assembly protein [Triangularia setosa]|uniref:Nucleosome assembly protein n=1 Tax=Triangularia setosa TaxID=2587417 RepID=A0AAN6WCK5_9PEZI|nr:nucleosome assembly protein [Podospora setosa]
MAVTAEEVLATYDSLAEIEAEFDDVETEIIRHQYTLSKDLYVKRAQIVAKIEHFWPLVFEQAPMDIDEFIQPSDSQIILGALKSIDVKRFEIDTPVEGGDPRSVSIRFEFEENDHFENKVLEKKFWWRHGKDGFVGYVSEPVDIKWKAGKDLTNGLLSLAKAAWEEEKATPKKEGKEKKELTPKQKELKEKLEAEATGAESFFCFFGYIGERVSAEENIEALKKEAEDRKKRQAGEEVEDDDEEMKEDENEEDWEDEEDLDIFPQGDTVAMAIADDLWPNALKYFTQAQESDDLSDDEDDESEDDEEEEDGDKPNKKHKACAHGCKH